MDAARRVIDRLDRIESLRGGGAPPRALLDEVRLLLAESEDWLRSDNGSDEAKEVIHRIENALLRGEGSARGRGRTLVL
jgi:hypothetical protein